MNGDEPPNGPPWGSAVRWKDGGGRCADSLERCWLLVVCSAGSLGGQEAAPAAEIDLSAERMLGVGMQLDFPFGGLLSGRVWLSDGWGGEAIVFVGGDLADVEGTLSLRGLARIADRPVVDFYAATGVSMPLSSHGGTTYLTLAGGIEFGFRFAPDLAWNVEFGVAASTDREVSRLFGTGIHFYFSPRGASRSPAGALVASSSRGIEADPEPPRTATAERPHFPPLCGSDPGDDVFDAVAGPLLEEDPAFREHLCTVRRWRSPLADAVANSPRASTPSRRRAGRETPQHRGAHDAHGERHRNATAPRHEPRLLAADLDQCPGLRMQRQDVSGARCQPVPPRFICSPIIGARRSGCGFSWWTTI